jgi:prolyl-tRNA synthetase
MRLSQTLIPTLRDAPQDAEIESHKLMMRAGLIRKLSAGLYTFMPLGLRALRNVETIIRDEMNRAGAIEVLMPSLQPKEIWEITGRYETLKKSMFRFKDRQDREMVLGPTHEEVITDLVTHELNSYRHLPRTFYQIQTKFRDEIRPRFGLMRAREFIMKDAYSFDLDWDCLDRSYQAMYKAYQRIFDRCGLRVKIVEADTGAMGGNASHEFMVLADSGEDGIVECEACAYAANVERAERALKPITPEAPGEAPAEIATPNARTIEEVSKFLKIQAYRLVKTLIYLADGKPVAALVPGNRDLNEIKLAKVIGCKELVMADAVQIQQITSAPAGFAGPVGLSIPIYAETALKGRSGMATGANKQDTHLLNVSLERDVPSAVYLDLVNARTGDACPRCADGKLREMRGIEVGHVFKLGTKYSEAFNACYLDGNKEKKTIIMGCYGIGVTRTLQAVIEQSHDENGIIWPVGVAPFIASILPLSANEACMSAALKLEEELTHAGITALVDDRDERPGVKFKDADLLGFPIRIVVSDRSLAEGKVEIRKRTEKTSQLVPVADALGRVEALIS